ncbi:MAG TPA: recombinase family protein [bacterium]|nr:recombinase family protein [bacterium]
MSKIVAYVTKNRIGKPDEKQRAALAAHMTAHQLKPEIIEDAYSKKKPWKKRAALAAAVEALKSGDTIIFPGKEYLGLDAQDRIALLAELLKKKVIVHLIAEGIILKGISEEGTTLFSLFALLLAPEKKSPGRKPGSPAKKKRGRPAKKKRGRPAKKKVGRPPKNKVGRPPKRKVGRPKAKKKPGRPPARKKRVSSLQGRFKKEILTIRKYLVNRFSVKTIAEMLEMPYQPLRALIKKHPTLKELVKKGR